MIFIKLTKHYFKLLSYEGLSPNKMLPISVRLRKKYAMGQGNNFRVYIIYNSTSFEHMKHAIKRFEKCRRNADIREFLLGQHVLNDVNEYNISLRRKYAIVHA